jgi:rifampicin phosphotransferase
MFISAGLTIDTGDALSHAAVVAREPPIPAVVNTGNATTVLRSGDRVRLHGPSRTIEILEPAPAR